MKKSIIVIGVLSAFAMTSCNKENAVCKYYGITGNEDEITYEEWMNNTSINNKGDGKFNDFKAWCKNYNGEIEYK